jgi:hypothetical protein
MTRESVTVNHNHKLTDNDGKPTGEKEARATTFTIETPDNLAEAVNQWGEDLVFNIFDAKLTIKIQDAARSMLKGDTPATPDEIQEAMDAWTPTESSRARLTPEERAERVASGRTADELEQMIAALRAEQEKRAAA